MRTLVFLLFTCIAAAGCGSSTYVTNSWTKPGSRLGSFRRIAVLALVGDESRGLRQQMETSIVSALAEQGYPAYSTYAQFGPQRLERDEEQAVARLQGTNSDAILTVVLLDKAKEQNYTPGRVTYAPVGGYYNRFWGYYSNVYDRMYVPGYYTTNTRYFWETNLYDLKQTEESLVYSAQSESFDPSSAESLGRQYAKAIVKDMNRAGIVREKK